MFVLKVSNYIQLREKYHQNTIKKGTTETNTHNFCLESKLTAYNYGKYTIKTPSKKSIKNKQFLQQPKTVIIVK